ncbi:peptidylprolyl isomerase [Thiomicrorhabdus sp. 6S3-12]|uniref:peptidylprolyl isomerase n=1 Tax=Thiomicrorhabdus sp. 6S3-12 TaxID=2819681 RepID=UPI001AAD65E5|nr:peptidylprolyl isomerase [Thiomicrorhabdus sp. 6S3-12]MBO1922905.1 peptidylprolyl isomerase [Thiomicrorhabdus sp. 6S3-12]
MKSKLNSTLLSLLTLFAIGGPVSAVHAAETPVNSQDALVDSIVAVVNDRIILKSELNAKLLEQAEQLKSQNISVQDVDALREQVLDSLILQAVQLSRAEQIGLKISDQELNQQMEKVAAQNNLSLLELRNRLNLEADNGFNRIRDKIRNQMIIQKLRQKEVVSRAQVTESEINNYLKRMTLANKYREIELQHILIALPESATQQQRRDALQKITQLRQRIVQGEDFAQLAVRYSNGAKALDGGNLGWMKDSEVPTFFAKPVEQLSLGQVSQVIQSPSGFHLIKIADERQAGTQKVDEYHLYRFLILSDDAMQQSEAPQSLQSVVANIKSLEDFEALNQTYSDIPEEVNADSDMGWRAQEELAPELQSIVATLDIGQATQPIATDRGWLIYYLDAVRSVSEDAADKKEQAARAVRMRKANEMFDLWLRRLRDEAFVRINL